MKLRLQFIQRLAIPWWGLAAMLATSGFAFVCMNAWINGFNQVQRDIAQNDKLQQQLKEGRQLRQQAQNSFSPQDIQRSKDEKIVANALNYPWNQIFAEIEQTQEPGVALLAFNHEQSSELSQITVESLDTPSIIRYVRQINGEHGEGQWYISNYQMQTQNFPPTVKANLVSK